MTILGQLTSDSQDSSTTSRRVVIFEALIVGLAISALYLLTLAGNHTEAEDSLRYLDDIRSGNAAAISSPYHLAYGWCSWLAYHVALIFGYSGGPLLPVQVLNSLTGALGIAVLWILLRSVPLTRISAAAGCGLVAFSYGYWWYSVEVEVYILSTFLLIVCLLLAYRAATKPSWPAFAVLGAVNGVAILAHNTNVLFAVVTLVALLFASRVVSWSRVLLCGLAYAGAGIVSVVVPYLVVILSLGLRTPNDVYFWLTRYAQSGRYGAWELSSIPKAMVGLGRSIIGGHFAFSLDPVRQAADAGFANKSLREETFLVRDFPDGLAWLLLALVLVFGITFLLPVFGWLRRPRLVGRARTLAILCVSWFVPYCLFFIWWEPQNIEFWIAPSVPLAILFALILSGREWRGRRQQIYVAILLGTLFMVNLLGSILPQHDPQDDYWRVRTSWYEGNTASSDLIVAYDYQQAYYLHYFTRAQVLDVQPIFSEFGDTAALPIIERKIAESGAQRVLISSEVFYPGSDEFSRCTDSRLCKVWAPAMRTEFLSRTRVIAEAPLESVREIVQN